MYKLPSPPGTPAVQPAPVRASRSSQPVGNSHAASTRSPSSRINAASSSVISPRSTAAARSSSSFHPQGRHAHGDVERRSHVSADTSTPPPLLEVDVPIVLEVPERVVHAERWSLSTPCLPHLSGSTSRPARLSSPGAASGEDLPARPPGSQSATCSDVCSATTWASRSGRGRRRGWPATTSPSGHIPARRKPGSGQPGLAASPPSPSATAAPRARARPPRGWPAPLQVNRPRRTPPELVLVLPRPASVRLDPDVQHQIVGLEAEAASGAEAPGD